ncbi:MAG: glycosyltransferase family 4 protein [Candidatus Zambryskibacteria bacterium]|nr:glycosyltransferase family 4 protein [Candidatus Zambryskibacteria bacterium]
MNIKGYIPKFLKYPLITAYILYRCILRGLPKKTIALNLAGVLPSKESLKVVHGGKVKLLHLRERFGDTWKRFNLAYLVSSGLPFAPNLWIKIYKLFGVKIFWNQNGVAYRALYPEKTVERINGLMRPMHKADYVIYQTEFVKRCADKYLGEFKGASSVIINPVDTKHFKPRETALPDEPLMIIMSGNHFESKERMDISVGAIRELGERGINTKLIIIGEADYEMQEEWIEKTGAFTQEEAPRLYQKAHLLLHLKYLDPCPTLVLEAMACGLPVISSASGGLPEMVDNKSGVLIPVVEDFENLHYPSAGEVASAIVKVKESYKEYSENARKQALKFDKEVWLDKHEEIFNHLCRKSQ